MPINKALLKTELVKDPIARGYSGLTDEQAAATFTVQDRQANRETLDGGFSKPLHRLSPVVSGRADG